MAMFNAENYDSNSDRKKLEPGTYIAMLVDDEETGHVSIKQGNKGPYLSLTYKILSPRPYQGLRVWDNQSLHENSLYRLANLYKAVEPEEQARAPFDTENAEQVHAALYYKPVKITIELEEQRGGYKPKFRPRFFDPVLGDEFDQMMDLAGELINDPNTGAEWGNGPRNQEANDPGGNYGGDDGPSFEDDDDVPF